MAENITKPNPQRATKAKTPVNVWLNTHDSLNDEKKIAARNYICAACDWSVPTFYRKLNNPLELKSIEKPAIAKAYRRSVQSLFPDNNKAA